jgi:hypothetical protein
MSAFFKTLFGDARTVVIVALVLLAEVVMVTSGNADFAVLVIPLLVLAGTGWLATR